ncbi:MAG: RHS repeat-associated core domain-containing protein [Burkholderiales bacterium]|nr:RHS repeat-associated core domain-containing protein [Phycisphaerae bacterium]
MDVFIRSGNHVSVQYTFADGAVSGVAKYVRLSSVINPSGVTRCYNYPSSGIGAALNRLDNIDAVDDAGSNQLAHYVYLGANTIVEESHPILGYSDHILDYNSTGNYEGWDRFMRVINQRWHNTVDNYNYDQFQYTYDRNSNIIAKQYDSYESHYDIYDEAYTYDGLDRLTKVNRGNLSSGTITDVNALYSELWTLDALGNWISYSKDTDGYGGAAAVTQTRSLNSANEITNISDSGWTDPQYDASGNMSRAPKSDSVSTALGQTYDGWNQQVGVDANNDGDLNDSGDYRYAYDGLGRRIRKFQDTATDSNNNAGTTEHFYYNDNYQVMEVYAGTVASGTETVDNDVKERYLWSISYIDALVVAEFDTNTDGTTDNQLWPLYDANYNVTTIIDILAGAGGAERYLYSPYGQRTIMDGSYGSRSTSSYGWTQGHQGLRLDGETGNYYNRARYLSSSLGVFGQRDPLGTAYQDGLNLYQYEGSNPLTATDPSGMYISPYHYWWTYGEMKKAGCSSKLADWTAWANVNMDFQPGDEDHNAYSPKWTVTRRHAMRGKKDDSTTQSPEEAEQEWQKNIDDMMTQATNSCDTDALGEALHAAQDRFTRAHSPFQEWTNAKGVELAIHVLKDATPTWSEWVRASLATRNLVKQFAENCCKCDNGPGGPPPPKKPPIYTGRRGGM